MLPCPEPKTPPFTRTAVPACLLPPFLHNLDFLGFNQASCPTFQPTSTLKQPRLAATSGIWHFHHNQPGAESTRLTGRCAGGCQPPREHREREHGQGVRQKGHRGDFSPSTARSCDLTGSITFLLAPLSASRFHLSWAILKDARILRAASRATPAFLLTLPLRL